MFVDLVFLRSTQSGRVERIFLFRSQNAESLRDPLRGRHATGSSTDVAISDVELEAAGALRLHETFDMLDSLFCI